MTPSRVPAPDPVRLTVWSDVLCPWCYNGAVRLHRIAEELADTVAVTWKSYLLRPTPQERSFEKFKAYTESWRVPAGQADGGRFRPWASDEPAPSHSVPPQVACKAAARQGGFDRFHLAAMDAYFWDNRNVTARATLLDIAAACNLDVARFQSDLDDPALEQAVLADYREAIERGINGVPTVVVDDEWAFPGAQDIDWYKRMITKRRTLRAGLA